MNLLAVNIVSQYATTLFPTRINFFVRNKVVAILRIKLITWLCANLQLKCALITEYSRHVVVHLIAKELDLTKAMTMMMLMNY